jgi:hypothetical protein
MSVDAPRKTREEIKAELDAMLADVDQKRRTQEIDLPAVLGDYKALAGRPGWYLRPMKLRQQMRMAALSGQVGDSTEAALRGHVVIAGLLLYRVLMPNGDMRAWAEGIANGTAFQPATEDDILDAFELDELNAEVLKPMGFGWKTTGPTPGEVPAP